LDEGCHSTVKGNGAILMGMGIVADSYWRKPYRIVTHAHADHVIGLRKSVKDSIFIIATETTFKFLDILGYRIPKSRRLPLDYGRQVRLEDDIIELKYARHIAGSAQVYVECNDLRIGYTSDFKMPGTEPIHDLNVLIIDATYGSPRLQRRWGELQP